MLSRGVGMRGLPTGHAARRLAGPFVVGCARDPPASVAPAWRCLPGVTTRGRGYFALVETNKATFLLRVEKVGALRGTVQLADLQGTLCVPSRYPYRNVFKQSTPIFVCLTAGCHVGARCYLLSAVI